MALSLYLTTVSEIETLKTPESPKLRVDLVSEGWGTSKFPTLPPYRVARRVQKEIPIRLARRVRELKRLPHGAARPRPLIFTGEL